MSKSRREFLMQASLALAGAAAGCRSKSEKPAELPPGAPPPSFGTPVGPEVSSSTFAEAQKLVQVELTNAERDMAARSWRVSVASLYERRTGPRKVALEATLAPWSRWEAVLPGEKAGAEHDRFLRSKIDPGRSRKQILDAVGRPSFAVGTQGSSTHDIWTYYYADGTMTVNLTDGYVKRISLQYGAPKIPVSKRP